MYISHSFIVDPIILYLCPPYISKYSLYDLTDPTYTNFWLFYRHVASRLSFDIYILGSFFFRNFHFIFIVYKMQFNHQNIFPLSMI
uniref:Uncharacterized protein n=1 Tax=Heterorhabditis bacteriophora TaxID=37862 RepID=A0A1I7WKL3_HETBA